MSLGPSRPKSPDSQERGVAEPQRGAESGCFKLEEGATVCGNTAFTDTGARVSHNFQVSQNIILVLIFFLPA